MFCSASLYSRLFFKFFKEARDISIIAVKLNIETQAEQHTTFSTFMRLIYLKYQAICKVCFLFKYYIRKFVGGGRGANFADSGGMGRTFIIEESLLM